MHSMLHKPALVTVTHWPAAATGYAASGQWSTVTLHCSEYRDYN